MLIKTLTSRRDCDYKGFMRSAGWPRKIETHPVNVNQSAQNTLNRTHKAVSVPKHHSTFNGREIEVNAQAHAVSLARCTAHDSASVLNTHKYNLGQSQKRPINER